MRPGRFPRTSVTCFRYVEAAGNMKRMTMAPLSLPPVRNLALASLIAFASAQGPSNVSAANIWFAPRNQPPIVAPDFMELFQPSAPWSNAAAHVSVFKFYPQFVDGASDRDLSIIIADLERRHIAMAVEVGMVDYTDPSLCKGPPCGDIEGQGGQKLDRIFARLDRLGARVRYVAMDEPLWFGHIVKKSQDPNAPEGSIETIARNVARQANTARRYFPAVKIGDIEPLPGSSAPAAYFSDTIAWIKAYRDAAGRPLDFYDADVLWQDDDWARNLARLHKITRRVGIRYGVIYNAGPDNPTGRSWTAQALRHAAASNPTRRCGPMTPLSSPGTSSRSTRCRRPSPGL